jgi:hypothetical protein
MVLLISMEPAIPLCLISQDRPGPGYLQVTVMDIVSGIFGGGFPSTNTTFS